MSSREQIAFDDVRMAYYFLSQYRHELERKRLFYLNRFNESNGVMTNEKAKAEYVEKDIREVDMWLDRNKAYRSGKSINKES